MHIVTSDGLNQCMYWLISIYHHIATYVLLQLAEISFYDLGVATTGCNWSW
jgi:hypothetical protein